jgi:hypothetical protein
MIQLKCYKLPEQEQDANAFLATHKPAPQGISFIENAVFIFYDDGSNPVEYQIADLLEYLKGIENAMLQQEVGKATMEAERDTIGGKGNKGKFDELTSGIISIDKSMELQQRKADWIKARIAELQTK